MDKIEQAVKFLNEMNPMEIVDLTKRMEKEWGVSATPQMGTQSTTGPTEPEQAAQTEFTVVLASFAADKKMTVVKAVRDLTGLGLLESKQLVEGAPKTVKESVSKEEAENLKAKLTEAGGVIEVK